ncbi:MAG: serine hydrolase domain-containing protein [Planctomycetota bacterium]|nr:serine hydrolase domain-containing protein [Planctomycetota bacterium]
MTVGNRWNPNETGRFARSRIRLRRFGLSISFSLLLGGIHGAPSLAQVSLNSEKAVRSKKIDAILSEALDRSDIPGVVAAIVRSGEPLRVGCAGIRKYQEKQAITVNDKMHLGSCTKAMTATVIGRLVDRGSLDWASTLRECLPDLAVEVHPDYREVTIEQLLMHRGGMPAQAVNWWNPNGETVAEKRRSIAIESLSAPPEKPPGTGYIYSNLGYLVAGMMAAGQAGCSWEGLMKRELFEPLNMASAGFGSPGSLGTLEQPWGHRNLASGLVALQRDNAPALGPAGTVHCSLADWARFAAVHLDDRHPLISPSTREHLQTISRELETAGQTYACGWVVLSLNWSAGPVLAHDGSNTLWYSKIFVAPRERIAYLVVANLADETTGPELDRIVMRLIALDAH